jgi:U4/U6 small nuclear ribonucleoprotein PRP31
MNEDQMAPLQRGCTVGTDLCDARDFILQFVESRMEFIAPNICKIVGPGIAAKITAQAGGITALTKMPSCNIMLLGSQKKTLQERMIIFRTF